MKLGMIGLGKMGANMTQRLVEGGHQVVAFDTSSDNIAEVVEKGAIGAASIPDMIEKLDNRKVVWMMVPSGDITESVLQEVAGLLQENDIIIDGGIPSTKTANAVTKSSVCEESNSLTPALRAVSGDWRSAIV